MNDAEKIELTAEEREFIARFTAEKCRPHAEVMAGRLAEFVARRQTELLEEGEAFALAAAPRIGSTCRPEKAVSPDEEVTFTFASDAAGAWRAVLKVPPKAVADTMLSVEVSGGDGGPVAEGVLTLGGCALPLGGGRAEIPFGLFLNGIQKAEVALRRPDGRIEPGKLTFF